MEVKNSDFLDANLSEVIPSESIDFAVMEKSSKIKVVKGEFDWFDLGSFESLFEYFSISGAYVKDSNLVIAETAHVELHGLKNMMVIQSANSILVMPLSQTQEVKNIYKRLLNTDNNLIK
jgi:mannose-1-phosphate guanylyltransferase